MAGWGVREGSKGCCGWKEKLVGLVANGSIFAGFLAWVNEGE